MVIGKSNVTVPIANTASLHLQNGAIAFSYDLSACRESLFQFKTEDHRRSLPMTIQALASIRILYYLLAQKDADTNRVIITGGSVAVGQVFNGAF